MEKIKELRFRAVLLSLLVLLILPGLSFAAGLLKPVGGGTALRIISHQVDVTINNGFARTEVDQVFSNSSATALEGFYSFPLPKQASLAELSLWINEREIVGEVVEKERAREIYQAEKDQGRQTALAEKNDYKSFDVRVGNIPAHSSTRVRLVYYQPLEIDLNVGRYLYPLAEGNVDEERNAFWATDDQVDGPFKFQLHLKSAFPIKDVYLPGLEQEAVVHNDEDRFEVSIDRGEGSRIDKDIVFYYRLDDQIPARVELVPYKANDNSEGTFMLVMTPAADLQQITEGTDWTFVLDTSGSMSGSKIATLTRGVGKVIQQMKNNDRFRIITFNTSATELTPGFVDASAEQIQYWLGRIGAITAGGSTNLYAGLEQACRKLDGDRTSGVVLVTDGVANVGATAQRDFLELIRKQDIRLFTFVIGNSANQPLLARLAKDSGGFAMNISTADDIIGRLIQAKAKVLHQNMHNLRIDIDGEKVTDLTPDDIGSLYLGQQAVLFGHYRGSGPVKITMKAKISGQEHTWQTMAELPAVATDNPELERLWALAETDQLMEQVRERGETDQLKNEIVALGTGYSLVTDYTSMLVVTDEVMEEKGIQRRNADRIQRERVAQKSRSVQPVKNYRVDNRGSNDSAGSFGARSAPGIGSGPVGLLILPFAAWLNRRKKKS